MVELIISEVYYINLKYNKHFHKMNYSNFEQKLKKLLFQINESNKYMKWFLWKLKIIIYGKENKIFYKWDVVKINFWYNIWSEINKERYAVVCSPQFINKTSWNLIVLPLSSYKDIKKFGKDIHYILEGYDFIEKSVVLLSNVRDVSKKRVIKKVWTLDWEDSRKINEKLINLFKK